MLDISEFNAPPIFTQTAYTLGKDNYRYARRNNPNLSHLEKIMAEHYEIEPAGSFVVQSGMAALELALQLTEMSLGEEAATVRIFAPDTLYVELKHWFKFQKHWDVRYLDFHNLGGLEEEIKKQRPRIIVLDNPSMYYFEGYSIGRIADIAHLNGCKVIVDNSLLTWFYRNPFLSGADVVVESLTKYACGHGNAMGGFIGFRAPQLGKEGFDHYLSLSGRHVSPFDCYLITMGLETMGLRLDRISDSSALITNRLVRYLPTIYCGKGGLITISTGDEEENSRLLDSLQLFKRQVTYGCTYSIATPSYPRDMLFIPEKYKKDFTHFIRLSIGLEAPELLVSDIICGLANCKTGKVHTLV